jgi:hypothetical protein
VKKGLCVDPLNLIAKIDGIQGGRLAGLDLYFIKFTDGLAFDHDGYLEGTDRRFIFMGVLPTWRSSLISHGPLRKVVTSTSQGSSYTSC